MKTKILAITMFLIGTFIACKKVSENIVETKYSDVELNIDKNSSFAVEERKIKEGIMGFTKLTKQDRITIVKNIIMDNKNIANIVEVMPIIKKLKKENIIPFFKILIPNSNFILIDNEKVIANYHTYWKQCDFWVGYWNKKDSSWYTDHCRLPGTNLCMQYVPC